MRGSEDRSCRALWAAVRISAFYLRTLAFAVGGMEGSEQRRDGSDSSIYRLPLWGWGKTLWELRMEGKRTHPPHSSAGESLCVSHLPIRAKL